MYQRTCTRASACRTLENFWATKLRRPAPPLPHRPTPLPLLQRRPQPLRITTAAATTATTRIRSQQLYLRFRLRVFVLTRDCTITMLTSINTSIIIVTNKTNLHQQVRHFFLSALVGLSIQIFILCTTYLYYRKANEYRGTHWGWD